MNSGLSLSFCCGGWCQSRFWIHLLSDLKSIPTIMKKEVVTLCVLMFLYISISCLFGIHSQTRVCEDFKFHCQGISCPLVQIHLIICIRNVGIKNSADSILDYYSSCLRYEACFFEIFSHHNIVQIFKLSVSMLHIFKLHQNHCVS